jgi:uncharacterized protein with PQ loop repeat
MTFYNLNEIIGWIGGFLFSICALPQVIHTWKTKDTKGLSMLFLIIWFAGEILSFFYVISKDIMTNVYHFPLYLNYALNIVLIVYLFYAKIKYS